MSRFTQPHRIFSFILLVIKHCSSSHDTQQTVNSSVSAVARDIQRLGVVVRRGDKPHKLQVERLTQTYLDALANYEAVQRVCNNKNIHYLSQ